VATFRAVITWLNQVVEAEIRYGDPRFSRENMLVRFPPAAEAGWLPSVGEILGFMRRSNDLGRIFDPDGRFAPGGEQHLTNLLGIRTVFVEVFVDVDGYREPELRPYTRRVFQPRP